jgi:hypothetical protein
MNECVGKRDSNFAGSNLVRARQNNDFTAGVESQTCLQPDSFKTAASCDQNHAEAPAPALGVLNGEMVDPFTYYLFGTGMPGNQGSEKRMMWFLDCHLGQLAI